MTRRTYSRAIWFYRKIVSLKLGAILLIVSTVLSGQQWNSIGPYGIAWRTQFTVDGSTEGRVYAAALGMVYRTDNSGQVWHNISPEGLPYYHDVDLVISGIDDEVYLIDGSGRKVVRSPDAGQTWDLFFSDGQHRVFFLDADDASHMLAYRSKTIDSFTIDGTSDGGNTWEPFADDIEMDAWSLQAWVNPFFPDHVIVAQFCCGHVISQQELYKTNDGGETWEKINLGGDWLARIMFAPNDEYTVFFWLRDELMKTTDGWESWQAIGKGLPESFYEDYAGSVLAIDPSNSELLYAAPHDRGNRQSQDIYWSQDGGHNWSPLTTIIPTIRITSLATNPHRAGNLFAAAYPYGVLMSLDYGKNWEDRTRGLTMTRLNSVVAASADMVFAEVENMGILRTLDGGETWRAVVPTTATTAGHLLASKNDPNLVFTVALPGSLYINHPDFARTVGLAISEDAGEKWQYLQSDYQGMRVFDVASDDSTIYGDAYLGDVEGVTSSGIIKSNDRGTTWNVLEFGMENVNFVEKIKVDPRDKDTVYCLVWIRGPISDDVLIKSEDGGTQWETIAENVSNFFLNSTSPNYLYHTDMDGDFYLSSDQGRTWHNTESIPDTVWVSKVVAHPERAEVLYSAWYGTGVFESEDHGYSWSRIGTSDGTEWVGYLSVAEASSGSAVLFAGTVSNGIRAYVDSVLAGVQPRALIPEEFTLHDPFPSPFNPTTTIRYDLPEAGHVSLIIYDILGREVAVAVDSWQEAGMHDVVWSAADVPSGIYFVRMVSGGFSQVRKVTVLR